METAMVRLGVHDLDWATTLLTDAFLEHPPATTLFIGPRRREQTEYFMRCSCAYALLFGEGYSTPGREAVALWLLPGQTAMTPPRMYKAGMLSAPFHMGLGAFGRFMGFASHTDTMHQAACPMPHYYLFVLGVGTAAQGKGLGSLLVQDMLERVDEEKMPTFLETQNASNVGLYRKLGFDVHADAAFPKLDGLSNWAMVRPAAT